MQNEEYTYQGKHYVRVNKKVAREAYNKGATVFLIQDMMRLVNAWETPCPVNKKEEEDFDKVVMYYQHYNCDKERGRGVKYFIAL